MDISSVLQALSSTFGAGRFVSSGSGTIGTAGVYGAMVDALTDPMEKNYAAGNAGLQADGDLSTAQANALCWLQADTAVAYGNLARSAAGIRVNASLKGGMLHVLRIGAEFVSAPGQDGDLFVTGGTVAAANQVMTGATLLTLATSSTVSVSGDGNDVFSFGCRDAVSVTGTQNTLYGGPGSSSFTLSGHLNTFRGGEGCSTVNLNGSDAAANIVIGGVGDLVVNSTAPVTQFIGGPGDATLNLVGGDYSSILLGSGSFTGHLSGNGISLQTGSGCATVDIAGAGGGTVVTGSGNATISFTGNGAILLEGDASARAVFTVTGLGGTVCGGDVVTVNGGGMEVRSREDGLTGNLGSRFAAVLGNMASFARDPVVASAIAADNPVFGTDGTTAASVVARCVQTQPACGTGTTSARVINVNATSSAVYADTRYDLITVRGDSNNFYGGSAGRTVTISSGTHNLIWGSAGCNTYVGDNQANVLEYIGLPGSTTAPGPVIVNLGLGLALNAYGGLDRICGINWVEATSGSTLIGGTADATLTILGDAGLIRDGAGNDVLTATGSSNTLASTAGNDLLHTGGENNTYLIGSTCAGVPGATEIRQDFVGVTGTMRFLTPAATPNQLWFNRDAAGDLLVHVLGTREVVTVDNWFGPQATQLRTITAGCATVDTAGVNTLEAAMANYQSAHPGFDPNTASRLPSDAGLGAALAAAWH